MKTQHPYAIRRWIQCDRLHKFCRGRRITIDEARDCSVADLSVLASATGQAYECVFDAYDNPMNAGGTRSQQDGA